MTDAVFDMKTASPAAINEKILAELRVMPTKTLTSLCGRLGVAGMNDPGYRAIDRALQSLRRAGKISYDTSKREWSVVQS